MQRNSRQLFTHTSQVRVLPFKTVDMERKKSCVWRFSVAATWHLTANPPCPAAVALSSPQALSKLESVSDFGLLDWRDTAEVAVRAALVGGAQSCDVLVLRENSQSAPPHQEGETEKQALEMAAGVGLGGGGVYARRFFGSVNSDGGVLLRPVGGLEEDDLEQGDPIGVAGRVRRFAGS